MYPPPHHQVNDIQKMIQVIKEYPLGMMISIDNQKPNVTHIPFIYSENQGTLIAHIDLANPQAKSLTTGSEVTIVFKGPDTYISPTIYSSKQLPTWNYITVHITGIVRLIKDPEIAKDTMIAMTDFLEKNNVDTFVLEKTDERMARLINYIQAFEISITEWEGKFKLSQDKDPIDYENAKQELIKKCSQDASLFINAMYR